MVATWKANLAMVVWLTTFCILLFGGFQFNNWSEEFWKNIFGIGLLAGAAAVTGVFSYRSSQSSR